jgi:hypothetical protein
MVKEPFRLRRGEEIQFLTPHYFLSPELACELEKARNPV